MRSRDTERGPRKYPGRRRQRVAACAAGIALSVVQASTAYAINDIPTVINNTRNWLVGILASAATLFLTIGGVRYLLAGGDPSEVEKAKTALKAAAIGYVLAILAPIILEVLKTIVGDSTPTTPAPGPPVAGGGR